MTRPWLGCRYNDTSSGRVLNRLGCTPWEVWEREEGRETRDRCIKFIQTPWLQEVTLPNLLVASIVPQWMFCKQLQPCRLNIIQTRKKPQTQSDKLKWDFSASQLKTPKLIQQWDKTAVLWPHDSKPCVVFRVCEVAGSWYSQLLSTRHKDPAVGVCVCKRGSSEPTKASLPASCCWKHECESVFTVPALPENLRHLVISCMCGRASETYRQRKRE